MLHMLTSSPELLWSAEDDNIIGVAEAHETTGAAAPYVLIARQRLQDRSTVSCFQPTTEGPSVRIRSISPRQRRNPVPEVAPLRRLESGLRASSAMIHQSSIAHPVG